MQRVIAPDSDGLATLAAEQIAGVARNLIVTRGQFVLSLAGGSTPRAAYDKLASLAGIDWSRVLLIFGDERCVPPEHPQSNYAMVSQTLLEKLNPPPQVLRMVGEHQNPDQAALDYGEQLGRHLRPLNRSGADLALLGIGDDGHTASLFPGAEALSEAQSPCVATVTPDGSTRRLTLTVPFLKESGELLFLAGGAAKAAILPAVLEDRLDPERFPAQFFLRDPALNLTLLTDVTAVANLKE